MSAPSTTSTTLPWVDRPLAELVRLSWPVTVSMLSFSIMSLVDALMVGRLGSEQLAGVGLGGTMAYTLVSFGFGLVRGGKTLVSQAVGAGRRSEAGGFLGASLIVGFAFGLLAIALSWPIGTLISRTVATAAEGEHFRTYLMARAFGAPSAMVFGALREVRYGEGDSRSPMVATVIANLANFVLAYAFIFHLHLGVAGAGYATAIAQTIEPLVLAVYQTRFGWGISKMSREHVESVVRVGVPLGLQSLLEMGAFALLATIIASMSPVQMAAHQIALQIVSFSFLPAYAIGESAAVMAGQAVGAVRDDLVLPIARLAARVVTSYTALCSLAFFLFALPMASAFTDDLELRAAAVRLIRISVLFLTMDGLNMVSRAVLRGTGDVRFPAWVGVICTWLLTPPLAWLFGYHFGMGAFGGWLGLSGEVFTGAAIQGLRLWRGGWLPHAHRTRAEVVSIASATA
jgi:MATE family multidrug resistance protein